MALNTQNTDSDLNMTAKPQAVVLPQDSRPELLMAQKDDEDEIDLLELFYTLLAHWKVILLGLLAGALLAGVIHLLLVKPSYQTDAVIYITNTDSVISLQDLQLSSQLTEDYALIIKSRNVLKQVISELGLNITFEELSRLVKVNNPNGTHIIQIIVTCDDIELSRDIANALLNISINQIYQVVGSSEPTVIDYAEIGAAENVSPGLKRYAAIGGLAGALLVCVVVVVMMLMNTSIRTEDDVLKYLEMPVLASVPYYHEGK